MALEEGVRLAVDVRCELGESPLWNPDRGTLLWFDIFGPVLYEAAPDGKELRAHGFGEAVSAAALIDASSIAVAGSSGLYRLELDSGSRTLIAPLEADNPKTRPNDCRVGPGGAFWIGTMGNPYAEGAGSLYRFSAGKFDRILSDLTAPNSLAFSPDGKRAYFSDTIDSRILVFTLDPRTGTPTGEPYLFADLSEEGLYPDGSVVDMEGCLWNAQWGAGRVARYLPDGKFDHAVEFPVTQTTCPAFGGPDLRTMFVTTGWRGLEEQERDEQPLAGAVFAVEVDVPGLPEGKIAISA